MGPVQAEVYRIALEGGISAGKSTILDYIERVRPQWICHREPVERWQNWDGFDYLHNFFKQRTSESRRQLDEVILHSYTEIFYSEPFGQIQIYERSPYSAATIFSRVHMEMGYLDEEHRDWLLELYRLKVKPLFQMDASVYLRTPPGLCVKRRKARMGDQGDGLDADGNVLGLSYEETAFQCHEDIFGPDVIPPPSSTLIIDELYGERDVADKAAAIIRYIDDRRFLDGTTIINGGAPMPLPFPT